MTAKFSMKLHDKAHASASSCTSQPAAVLLWDAMLSCLHTMSFLQSFRMQPPSGTPCTRPPAHTSRHPHFVFLALLSRASKYSVSTFPFMMSALLHMYAMKRNHTLCVCSGNSSQYVMGCFCPIIYNVHCMWHAEIATCSRVLDSGDHRLTLSKSITL